MKAGAAAEDKARQMQMWQDGLMAAGTGISATGTYPDFTITNTAPDQTVVLTAGAGITITGTYPNFTISLT